MGVIKRDSIVAWWYDGELFCHDCVEDESDLDYLPEDLSELDEGDVAVCDWCHKRIR